MSRGEQKRGCARNIQRETPQKISRKLKKPLDKPHDLWYNEYIKGKENPPNQKGIDTMTTSSSSSKMTYVKALDMVLTSLPTDFNAEAMEKLTALRASLVKKSASDHKPTAKQMENEKLMDRAFDLLVQAGKALTVSELMQMDADFGAMSNQKVATLLRSLVNDGKVKREEVKRKAYFSPADAE